MFRSIPYKWLVATAFVLALFMMVALLAFFPDLAMWLPRVVNS